MTTHAWRRYQGRPGQGWESWCGRLFDDASPSSSPPLVDADCLVCITTYRDHHLWLIADSGAQAKAATEQLDRERRRRNRKRNRRARP